MQKLLIVGIDSLAGANLALALADHFAVTGVTRCSHFDLPATSVIHVASRWTAALKDAIASVRPNWLVYCGPTSQSRWDWIDAVDVSDELAHVEAAFRAACTCESRFTLISSDALFTGPHLFHNEVSASASSHPAARAARQIEQSLAGTTALIVRTHLFGWSPGGDSFAERLWLTLAEGRSVSASGAVYSAPILATDFAELLHRAYRRDLTGVYHLAGAERTSAWQFASALAATAGAPARTARLPAAASGTRESLRRLHDETSLDSRKIQRALSTALPLLRDGLRRFAEQATSGHRDRMIAATEPTVLVSAAA